MFVYHPIVKVESPVKYICQVISYAPAQLPYARYVRALAQLLPRTQNILRLPF